MRVAAQFLARWPFFFVTLLSSFSSNAVDYLREVKPILTEHCYRCHGAQQRKAGLRLDTATWAKAGGESGPGYVAGKADESLIVQVVRGTHTSLSRMPYKKPPLSERQIALIAGWINAGAVAPPDEAPESNRHWSFSPPGRPLAPKLTDETLVRSPVDRFIQKHLETENVRPASEARRATLLRRLSLDLTGLPPSPEEIERFIHDSSPDAYEHQVQRLLSSPHYGERWARWWLDAARYGDSNGYSIDAPRQIWKYRDWVVSALNRDQPFDQFTIDQLAGDLLPNASVEQVVATGFNRNTQINQEGGIDPEQFRVESVMDRVNTFGTVFLGLTIGCAQCHDHKFDPISQREYYQLYAFFNGTEEDGHGKAAPTAMFEIPGEFTAPDEKALEEAREELDRYLNTKGSAVLTWEKEQIISGKPWSDRTLEEKRSAYGAFRDNDSEFKSRDAKVATLEKREARPITTLVMRELKEPRDTFRFTKGDFTRPAEKVEPDVPAVLHKLEREEGRRANRLDLARWVVSPQNPLLARVIANRVWQQYFGRGLVETENDFGTQGAAPSHPELLDWLASEFMQPSEAGVPAWSLKHLHRLIVTSHTYRQSSGSRPELLNVDVNNRWLARQSRLRLDAEVVRDSALAISGLLSRELGGPPVFPPQPEGVMNLGQVKRDWKASVGSARYRRALYTHVWRATPHPALSVFDAADGFSTCTRRIRSNTPLQALTLLNDRQFFEFAEAFAQRIDDGSGSETNKVERAFLICLGRQPAPPEKRRLLDLLASTPREEKMLTLARVMLNLDETITRE